MWCLRDDVLGADGQSRVDVLFDDEVQKSGTAIGKHFFPRLALSLVEC